MTRPDPYMGWITAEFAAAAPEFHDLVKGAGQPVTIHSRAGLPPAEIVAYIYQEDNSGEQSVSEPGYKVLGWQGFFIPADAPALRGREWYIEDAQGRVFVPDGDVQDVGAQGVLLWAHFHPLPERTRVYAVEFQIPDGPPVRVGGQWQVQTREELVFVRLTASADPKVRDMVGADVAEVAVIGRWGTLLAPRQKPPGIAWGTKAPLTLDGEEGVLTLQIAYPDNDLGTESAFGARFLGVWRAGEE